jgi:predicted transposase YbfD/YdcC
MRLPSLRDALAEVPEFRQAQGRRYELLPVLLLCCVAVMCGARSQSAIAEWGQNYGVRWLSRLGIRRPRGPSQPTLHRIFKGLDCARLELCVTCWVEQVLVACAAPAAALEALAIDGKTLRGSAGQGAAESHLVSALSHRLGVVVAQLGVADKSHELGHLEPLLDALVLDGRVVTADALHTHADVARSIISRGGDYLLPVKENQPVLRSDIALVFAHGKELADTITQAQTTDCHGGRVETRRLSASTALQGYLTWPGHAQVLELHRMVTQKRTSKTRHEVVYGITSLAPERASAAQLLRLWREHWHVENRLHWVRDVTFDEDRSQVRAGRAPQVMAALRNVAISALRLCGAENIAAACRRYAARPALALAAVGIRLRE